MNKRARTVLSLSAALPIMALAAFLLIQPQKLSAEEGATCVYAGQSYSLGATIAAACPAGQVQTCVAQDNWSACAKSSNVVPVENAQ
jgi:hypothetical protein